jgi:RNA polymerase sigma factor (sigma-70 family)
MVRSVACWSRLIRILSRRGRSREDAEDLIQEALLRLEQYRRTAEVRDNEAFLTRTVLNLASNQHRRERLVTYANEPVEQLDAQIPLTDPGPTPDRIVEGEQRLGEISRILDAVGNKRVREIYLLSMAGYRQPEIAKAFGISVPTVQREIAVAVWTLTKTWACNEFDGA